MYFLYVFIGIKIYQKNKSKFRLKCKILVYHRISIYLSYIKKT